jgi:copper chaperone
MSVFKVEDMSCGHCEKAIREELKKENNNVTVNVDLSNKIVKVDNLPDDRVLFLLREIGYNPEKIS